MALVDYSLERFPEELEAHLDTIDGVEEIVFGEIDIEAEDQAHRTNVMIANWIEQLATSSSGNRSHFQPHHMHVGVHYVDLVDNVQTEKFEVAFFHPKSLINLFIAPVEWTPFHRTVGGWV